ncbi:MAG: FmdB family zinc ribbon protein [Bacillota bacterium]|nr:zinc ribbon domain-containing protein [Thermanaerosceptrum fracticalcis]
MAVYDFFCKACQEQFSVSCSISERKNVKCPKCGTGEVQRIYKPLGVMNSNSQAGSSPLPSTGFG